LPVKLTESDLKEIDARFERLEVAGERYALEMMSRVQRSPLCSQTERNVIQPVLILLE
jgi:hypothetical protein